MTPEQWQKIEKLFGDAMALSGAEREAFIARESGDDATLRAEVESLLAHHVQAPSDFMKTPAGISPAGNAGPVTQSRGATDSQPAAHPAPERIGSYTILREIGRGGMGRVYQAPDQRRPSVVQTNRGPATCRS